MSRSVQEQLDRLLRTAIRRQEALVSVLLSPQLLFVRVAMSEAVPLRSHAGVQALGMCIAF